MTLEESVRLVDAVLQGYISIDDIKPSHNDHEEQLKALQHRSCDGCKYYTSTLCPVEEFSITSAELEKYPFYCNRHKPKEQ